MPADEFFVLDPGGTSGWATFSGGSLTGSGHFSYEKLESGEGLSKAQIRSGQKLPPKEFLAGVVMVAEKPTYRGFGSGENKGSPNALIELGVRLGVVVGLYRRKVEVVEFVSPNEWKGSVPKPICHARILKSLKPDEMKLLDTNHNALDAVGIGLWRVGRYRK